MSSLRGTLILFAGLICVSCDSATPTGGATVTDSAGIRIVTSDPLNADATCTLSEEPVVTIGEEGDDENLWFSEVGGAVRLSDGSIAVLDGASNQVRLFAEDGRHLRTAGGSGEGPGEFELAWYLWVLPGDTLWAGNVSPWYYNLFTRDGEFVRAVERVTPFGNQSQGGGVLDGGVSITATTSGFVEVRNFTVPDTLVVQAHGPTGELVTIVAQVPNMIVGVTSKSEALGISLVVNPVFVARALIDAGGTTIAIGHTREPEIRLFDASFQLRGIVRWHDPGRHVTPAHVSAWRDSYVERQGGRDSERWNDFDEVWVDPDRPAADVFPAFTSITVGRDGRLWVMPYRKPGQESREWMAFEPDGTFQCHLARTHENFTPEEFGADYVLGVEADELGIQTVAMYRLSREE